MNYYYFDPSGQKQGPVDNQQLQALVTQRIIMPESQLETEDSHKEAAGQIPGLTFPEVTPSETPPVETNPFTGPALTESNPFTTPAPQGTSINKIIEVAKQKTVEFVRRSTPIVQAGLNVMIRGVRHGTTIGKERFMRLDRRGRLAVIVGAIFLVLVGGWWMMGSNTDSPRESALADYQKLAKQGDADAQYELGISYLNGKDVVKNEIEAVKWFRKAAERGHAKAQCRLGTCYRFGEGVLEDRAEAAKWFRKAAEQGDKRAQFYLAMRYKDGDGVVQDQVEAAKWFRKAAEQGELEAQYFLGLGYMVGIGVQEDRIEGVKWLSKAAEQGHEKAKESLDRWLR